MANYGFAGLTHFPDGKVIHRQSGRADVLRLKRAIVDHLGRTY